MMIIKMILKMLIVFQILTRLIFFFLFIHHSQSNLILLPQLPLDQDEEIPMEHQRPATQSSEFFIPDLEEIEQQLRVRFLIKVIRDPKN